MRQVKLRSFFGSGAAATKGAVFIEMAAAALILCLFFIGMAVVGMKLLDFHADTRAARSASDMAWILDEGGSLPTQSDFDLIGQQALEVARAEPAEDFQMYFTVVEYDHLGGGLRIDWQGEYGVAPDLTSRVVIDAGVVMVNGYDLTVRDDERLIIVEIYRTRRGLFVDYANPVYSLSLAYKYDPEHA